MTSEGWKDHFIIYTLRLIALLVKSVALYANGDYSELEKCL